jgi:hypothetical protein
MPLASTEEKWNVYATPAAISLAFLVVETLFLITKLPETKDWKKQPEDVARGQSEKKVVKDTAETRLARLRKVGWYHCAFLLFFSGVRCPASNGREIAHH